MKRSGIPRRSALMTRSRSLAARAVLALALMLGFYVFALAIAVAVASIPYGEYLAIGRVHFQVLAGCLGAAGAILWALVPRADRFHPPGPVLTDANAPSLLRLVRDVARATNQPPPAEVYLLNEVNAWVTYRGGVMGFGSRRVMGVGLPLLTEFSRAELRAIIAHEFGHYVAGDVALGPWIYKTRAAIGRALVATAEGWLAAPFQWYARLFMTTTQAISREQEFQADRVSALVAGNSAAQGALRRAAMLAPAHGAYLQQDLVPVLKSGHLPPITEGFRQFLSAPETAALTAAAHKHALGADGDEFDSHPPLGERLQALDAGPPLAGAPDPGQDRPLLDAEAHARAWVAFVLGDEHFASLRPLDWEAVGAAVHQPAWAVILRHHATQLAGLTAEDMPVDREGYRALGASILEEEAASGDHHVAFALQLLALALADKLARAGWVPRSRPGATMTLERAASVLDLQQTMSGLGEGKETPESWGARCRAFGISGMPLVPPSQGSSSVTAAAR
jgi:heat shock protein HtpX